MCKGVWCPVKANANSIGPTVSCFTSAGIVNHHVYPTAVSADVCTTDSAAGHDAATTTFAAAAAATTTTRARPRARPAAAYRPAAVAGNAPKEVNNVYGILSSMTTHRPYLYALPWVVVCRWMCICITGLCDFRAYTTSFLFVSSGPMGVTMVFLIFYYCRWFMLA